MARLGGAWLTHAEIVNGRPHMLKESLTVRDSVPPVVWMDKRATRKK